MTQNSPNLELPFLQPSQAQKHVTHNEALRRLDIVVQLRLQQTGASVPPAQAQEGDIHGLGTGATGAWAGQDGMLAAWLDAVWHFIAPQIGWRAWDVADEQVVIWDGAGWTALQPALDDLDRIGIGTSADATNRLAVQSPATLLSHAGQGHQVKVNKASVSDTASLLFQSGWTGHAEMGLAGQNAFSVKVSDDGSNWTEALRLDGATGQATGSAVQTDAADATPGRLLATGAFGLGETGAATQIPDIDATDTPAGAYRYTGSTLGAENLPAALQSSFGVIRIERSNTALLRQTAWRNSFDNGIWTRTYSGGSWGSWRQLYDQTTILGAVSESGGQPTGAVIERGTSGQGDYVRFADGTQICTRFFSAAASSHTWSFPATFISAASVSLQALARHATAPRLVTEGGDLSATGVTLKVWNAAGAAASAPVHATATGRWF
ncbi:DUF2793 domain-containing protein [Ruegeria sp. 2205SS24-7]|uniref:DUF2793 domain-containing protein n=1 Tax=Ruegeria discodermiae TaxID=3064389 RepID=UPI0027424888|nr:DUF2793 domain-containing protein [Ruegeria sp. 2205SS24-7]MDP5220737.1 DUF2793 domain-containing protein [Ruegeria sp. 2205SS24-7]